MKMLIKKSVAFWTLFLLPGSLGYCDMKRPYPGMPNTVYMCVVDQSPPISGIGLAGFMKSPIRMCLFPTFWAMTLRLGHPSFLE